MSENARGALLALLTFLVAWAWSLGALRPHPDGLLYRAEGLMLAGWPDEDTVVLVLVASGGAAGLVAAIATLGRCRPAGVALAVLAGFAVVLLGTRPYKRHGLAWGWLSRIDGTESERLVVARLAEGAYLLVAVVVASSLAEAGRAVRRVVARPDCRSAPEACPSDASDLRSFALTTSSRYPAPPAGGRDRAFPSWPGAAEPP